MLGLTRASGKGTRRSPGKSAGGGDVRGIQADKGAPGGGPAVKNKGGDVWVEL